MKKYEFKVIKGEMTTDEQIEMARDGWTFAGRTKINGRQEWNWRRPKLG